MTCLRKSEPLNVLNVHSIDYEKWSLYSTDGYYVEFDDIMWLKIKDNR